MLPIILAGALTLAQTAEPDAASIVERAARAYQGLTSFQADFRQIIADSMIGTFASRGRLVQAGTDRLSMRFSDPAGEAIVMDGSRIWIYTPSTTPGQVIRTPIPSDAGYGPNVIAWLLTDPATRYQSRYLKSEPVGGHMADVIVLVPNDSDLPFREATIWLDQGDALPRRLEIAERSGTHRTLTLSGVRTNTRVSDATFRFVVPAGVRVVDQ